MTDKNKRYEYIIYKLCSNDCTDFYVGSTRNMVERKRTHKSCCNNVDNKEYNCKKYETIRANGGWYNWRIAPLELMKNATKLEAQIREEQLRVELDARLNSIKATRGNITEQEYHQNYRIDNKEHYQQYNKQHYIDNKETISAKQKQKHNCDCGGKYVHNHKARHFKTTKHKNYISKNNL